MVTRPRLATRNVNYCTLYDVYIYMIEYRYYIINTCGVCLRLINRRQGDEKKKRVSQLPLGRRWRVDRWMSGWVYIMVKYTCNSSKTYILMLKNSPRWGGGWRGDEGLFDISLSVKSIGVYDIIYYYYNSTLRYVIKYLYTYITSVQRLLCAHIHSPLPVARPVWTGNNGTRWQRTFVIAVINIIDLYACIVTDDDDNNNNTVHYYRCSSLSCQYTRHNIILHWSGVTRSGWATSCMVWINKMIL